MDTKVGSEEDLVRIAQEILDEGGILTRSSFKKKGVNEPTFLKCFPEGYDAFKEKYGFKIDRRSKPYTEDELLVEFDKFITEYKRIPTWFQLVRYTRITEKVWKKYIGKIPEIITRYRKWLKDTHPSSENIKVVDDYLKRKEETRTPKPLVGKTAKGSVGKTWEKDPGRLYGDNLNFGSMLLEPTTHDAVVLLFGMVAKALGFSILYVGKDYPDCEAMKRVTGRKGGQQPVKIEFERYSRDFDHPPEGCDLIVCWEDNWGKGCPRPVLELKKEIESLRGRGEFQPEYASSNLLSDRK